jgi:hypothetical protein
MPQSLEETAIFILYIMIMFLFSRKRFFSPGFCCALLFAAPLSLQLGGLAIIFCYVSGLLSRGVLSKEIKFHLQNPVYSPFNSFLFHNYAKRIVFLHIASSF